MHRQEVFVKDRWLYNNNKNDNNNNKEDNDDNNNLGILMYFANLELYIKARAVDA